MAAFETSCAAGAPLRMTTLRVQHEFDSSALLVMKAHQQNTWETFIFRSLDVCYAIPVSQDQKASLLQPIEFYWLVKGQKRAQGIGSEGLL